MSALKIILACASLGALTLTSSASPAAGETAADRIRETLQARYPAVEIVDIQPAALPGLYEVYTGREIVYTDEKADLMFTGAVIDTQTKQNLTQQRIDARNAIDFETLPFDKAIKVVRGSGQRKLAVFSDPDCPYCRQLESELQDIPDVTVYTFLFPLTEIHPEALARSKAIWCSKDRAASWTAWMLKQEAPKAAPCEDTPVEDLLALGRRLHVPGTPTLYFQNGQRMSRDLKKDELEAQLRTPVATP